MNNLLILFVLSTNMYLLDVLNNKQMKIAMNKLLSIMILFFGLAISGCASTTNEDRYNEFLERTLAKGRHVDAFDEILGKRLAEEGYSAEEIECQVKSEREHYLYRNLTAEDFKRETAENYKNQEKYRLNCKARQKEFEQTRMNREHREKAREDYQNGHIRQPSYDPNFEINRLRDDLTIQSIIQRGEAEKRELEIRRLESERSQRESMERVQEQRRQIEQSIQEDNRRHEMHKLRQDLLYKGIY